MTETHAYEYEWSENQAWTFDATVEAKPLCDVLTAASALVDEAAIRITPDEISTMAVDPAKVAMVEARSERVVSADGRLSFGLQITDLPEDLPPYFAPTDDRSVRVSHGPEDDHLRIATPDERSYEADAYDPKTIRDASWPDAEYDHSVTLEAPKVNGTVTAMAAAADDRIRLTPIGDAIRFEANDEDGEWVYEWELEAWNVGVGDSQEYSADYIRDVSDGLWPTGEYTVRFGREQPFELETDGLRFITAPRIMDR